MFPIRLCFDQIAFPIKPTDTDIKSISMRIGGCPYPISTPDELRFFTEQVGAHGCTFCPATFKNNTRRKDSFEQQQIIALDFDNRDPSTSVSLDEVRSRASKYDLKIVAAYDTFSSKDHDKFRVLFINDAAITDVRVMEAVQLALGYIFPEADPTCIKDVSKMYFGGKKLIYYNGTIPVINVETVFRSLTYYFEDQYNNHYREKLKKFSTLSGIALNSKGLLDVLSSDEPFETAHLTEKYSGASQQDQDREISANHFYIYNYIIIKANGGNFPRYYRVGLCTSNSSVVTIDAGNSYDHPAHDKRKPSEYHKNYRSSTLSQMYRECQLYRDLLDGSRKLSHEELFHLQINMRNIDSGDSEFLSDLRRFPSLYSDEKVREWKRHCKYNKQQGYHPSSCSKSGCPYRETCNHGENILTTVHPKRGTVERDTNFQERYYPLEEAEQDMRAAIDKVFCAEDGNSYIINAPCAIGKTTAALDILSVKGIKFTYAAPTILLETQIYDNALSLGLDVCKTPSLEQIAFNLPNDIKTQVRLYYMRGQAHLVHPYLEEVIINRDIPRLEEYMKERAMAQRSKGSIITTHRYLMNMDKKRLNTYDLNIIDEDLIYKSYITNQCSIPISNLHEEMSRLHRFPLLEQQDKQMLAKGRELLARCQNETYIHMDGFKWSYPKQKDSPFDDTFMGTSAFDNAAFCSTQHFYVRRASKNTGMKEDTVVFIKPFALKPANYMMLSATANETICRQLFGKNMVFHNCKQVEYKGNLYQFPGRSMSRSSIANNGGIVKRIMQKMGFTERNTITFANQEIGRMHFGNTEGLNSLEGEDLLVIGTPYHPEFLYKLVAHNLGFVFDEDEKMFQQYISHNGYKTWFTTFKDENLRAVHFWMVESELEQAVGRARLPRYDCNVYVFSNFPLKQAQMREFDYNKM